MNRKCSTSTTKYGRLTFASLASTHFAHTYFHALSKHAATSVDRILHHGSTLIMGYHIQYLLDQQVDDELVCKVCYGLLEKPRTMCAEGHAFCQSCWCQWLARKRSCPTCRGVIDEATPLIKNRLAERMVGELMSFCPFRDAGHSRDLSAQRDAYSPDKKRRRLDGDAAAATGCTWSGKICDLQAHIDTCDFALQPCKVSTLCTVSLPRGLIAEHERSCPHLRTLCVRCGRLVRVAALEHHKKSSKCHRAQSLLTEYLELLKHSAACIAQKVVAEVTAETATTNLSRIASNDRHRTCDRADCLKMETLLRHYAKCSSRQEGNCPSGVCDHITLLLQLHARDCTVTPRCPVPFCTQWRIPRLSQLVDCVSSPS